MPLFSALMQYSQPDDVIVLIHGIYGTVRHAGVTVFQPYYGQIVEKLLHRYYAHVKYMVMEIMLHIKGQMSDTEWRNKIAQHKKVWNQYAKCLTLYNQALVPFSDVLLCFANIE